MLSSPNALKGLFLASRPKTWSASLCPVFLGTAIAAKEGAFRTEIFGLTFLFALLIQIGTNYANDVFDFLKGADTENRQGPKRAVQQGWIAPRSMLIATGVVLTLAFFIAIPLMCIAGWWSLFITLICLLSAVLYTGGPKPLGYLGLGELFVFVFFGPVALLGTYFLQTGTVTLSVFLASLAPGALSTAILIANNLRDEATDRIAGKKTLIVRWGPRLGRFLYTASIGLAAIIPLALIPFGFPPSIGAVSCTLILAPIGEVFLSMNLNKVLQKTSMILLFYTLLFCRIILWP